MSEHTTGPGAQHIPVNVYETTEAVVVVAPMPGVQAQDVEITLESPTRVRLHADLRTEAPKAYVLHEWEYGCYERTVDLPAPVGWPVLASLGNGQLAVSLHRDGEGRADPITITDSAASG